MSTVALQLSDHDVARIATAVAAELKRQPEDRLLTPRQAAAIVGLTEKALERRRARGMPPEAVKKGGRCFYLRSVLAQYVAGGST
jgi:hypothetical protein